MEKKKKKKSPPKYKELLCSKIYLFFIINK